MKEAEGSQKVGGQSEQSYEDETKKDKIVHAKLPRTNEYGCKKENAPGSSITPEGGDADVKDTPRGRRAKPGAPGGDAGLERFSELLGKSRGGAATARFAMLPSATGPAQGTFAWGRGHRAETSGRTSAGARTGADAGTRASTSRPENSSLWTGRLSLIGPEDTILEGCAVEATNDGHHLFFVGGFNESEAFRLLGLRITDDLDGVGHQVFRC